MTREQIKKLVLSVLGNIAPEAALDTLDPDADLREELDIDSMDILNFVTGIHEETGVDIPEADYPKMSSLNKCIAYLHSRVKGSS